MKGKIGKIIGLIERKYRKIKGGQTFTFDLSRFVEYLLKF